jgi:signal transduction histidine kinase/CheY-like chemotaxis protein/HPt (histidine-containing phosphotransfer) domain-containing protein
VLSRFSEGQKLAAVAVVLALPLLVVSVAYAGVEQRRLLSGRHERAGVAYLAPLTGLVTAATTARHTVATRGRPDTAAINAAIDAVDRIDDEYGERLGIATEWSSAAASMRRALDTTDVAAGVRTYNVAIDAVLKLMTHVRDPSTALDGDVDSYYVINAVISQLPTLLNLSLRVMDEALVTAPDGKFGGSAFLSQVSAAAGRIGTSANSLQIGMGRAFAATNSPSLLALKDDVARVVAIYRAGSANVLRTAAAGGTIQLRPDRLTAITAQTVALSNALLPVVTRLIDARITNLRHRIYAVTAATGLALLLAAYVLLISIRQIRTARDQALASAEASSAFLATMSHEIRTPMNAVIGMTGLLLDTDLDADQREYASTVRDSGEALLGIINDILDFSKVESGQLELDSEPFDVQECVESALALVALEADRKGLELVGSVAADCPVALRGDVTRLRQILANLLSNAVKFTAKGEVVVTADAIRLSDEPDGPVELRIAVRDTGPGIPADRMDRVFRSFAQVDSSTTRVYGGTGLGLAISRRLAQAMDGDIEVSSDVGVGSTFTLTACLTECPDGVVQPVSHAGLAGASALIVDDNATNRRVLRLQLAGWGMACTDASSAAKALRLVTSGTSFDVAVLDLQMPEMDGAELASALRALPQTTDLPLLLLTSIQWRPTTDQRKLFTAILNKPTRAATLHTHLERAVAPGRTGSASGAAVSGHDVDPGTDRPDLPPLRILLAEDNPVNQKVAQLMLGKLGYRVDTVGNGLEAVRAVQQAPYDVILMDVQMPDMDGLEATRRIRADLPADQHPQIIALTASVLLEDRAACRAAGMDGYLAKPVRSDDLRAALAALVPVTGRSSGQATGLPAPTDGVGESADSRGAFAENRREPADRDPDAAVENGIEDAIQQRIRDITGPDPQPDERALVAALARSFTTTAPEMLARLEDAVHAGDPKAVAQHAHRLKGSAANLGVDQLAQVCADLENQARSGQLTGGNVHDPELAAAANELDRALPILTGIAGDSPPG